jgi:hypothetical protein
MTLSTWADSQRRADQWGIAMTEDLSRFCCMNDQCPDHGQRGLGNLTVCARYGKDKQRRLLYCRSCKYRFSERKGTPCSARS